MSAWKKFIASYSTGFKELFAVPNHHPHTIIWDHNFSWSATLQLKNLLWSSYQPCYKKWYSPMWHYCQCATMANMPYHKMACLCNDDTMQYWHDLPCLLHLYEPFIILYCGKPSNNVSHHNIVDVHLIEYNQLCYSLKNHKHLSEEEHYVRWEFKPSYFSDMCVSSIHSLLTMISKS